ncbi:hypothetical protein BOX15_Mlig027655g1 [Macrostomum lignano]|uniref:RING-type E3 ubiquitin transferase n=2 Tax=Macrostomum lignano TaxID=282301 RepID=A0A1I8H0E9_9PLAT|nr:hypothetical protein BOX15_Mlig027655g1 [Macrostomum lignano]
MTRPAMMSAESGTFKDLEEELKCPVCLSTFVDPCFVCSRHHTLCRGCHQAIATKCRSSGEVARCPICRERLVDRPLENPHVRGVVDSWRRREQWLHHAKCDAREGAGNCACLQQVFARCEHCDRNLCEMHYANDQMRFKEESSTLIRAAESANQSAKQRQSALQQWSRLFADCRDALEHQRQRFDALSAMAAEMADSSRGAALSTSAAADAVELREALDTGDLKVASVAFNRLNRRGLHNLNSLTKTPKVSPPVKSGQEFDLKATELGHEMERPFLEAVHGDSTILTPSGVLRPTGRFSAAGRGHPEEPFRQILRRFVP